MAETITAREANHHFSRILDAVAGGKEYVVTRNGTPVARITPERPADGTRVLTAEQEQALADLIHTALNLQIPEDADPTPFNREELYMERFEERPRREP